MTRVAKSIKELRRQGGDESRATFVTNEIFERAIALFLEKGFASTSMNDLATACQVTKPALYYYFPNKSALLERLYDHITRDFYDLTGVLAQEAKSPRQKLTAVILHQARYNIEQRRFLTVFWRERHQFEPDARAKLARREREFERVIVGLLEEGRAAGEFRDLDAETTAMCLLGLLSTVHRWAHHVGAAPEEVAELIVSLAMNGVSAVGPTAPDTTEQQ